MRVLDAGCGEGRHAFEVLRRRATVVAMDLRPADLVRTRYLLNSVAGNSVAGNSKEHAPEEIEPLVPALTLRGDTQNLPFASNQFERAVCSEVLEHVSDPARAAAELARVLVPGGMLAVSVPTPMTEWAFLFASDDYFNTPGGHVRIFTPRRLAHLLRGAGFDIVDLHFEHAFHSLYWWIRGVFGLHDEAHPVISHFRRVLTYVLFSPRLLQAESILDWVIPKSMVIYARKTE